MDYLRNIVRKNIGKTSLYMSDEVVDAIIRKIVEDFYKNSTETMESGGDLVFLSEVVEKIEENNKQTETYTIKNNVWQDAMKDVFANGKQGVTISNTGDMIHVIVPYTAKVDRKRLKFYSML